MNRRSLRTRLLAVSVLWLVAAIAGGGVALSHAFRASAESAFQAQLDSLLLAVVAALEVPSGAPARMTRGVPDARFEQVYSGWYWQVSDGAHELRSRSLWDERLVADVRGADAAAATLAGPRGEALRLVRRELRFPGRDRPIIVTLAGPEAALRRETARFDRLLALSLGVLGAGLVATVLLQVGYGLHPLRRLAHDVAEVRAGRRARLGTDYPSEVAPLARAIDELLDHDARLLERARASAADLAHALKTPLAVVAVEAGRDGSDAARAIASQVAAMSGLVDHHLSRAAAAGARDLPGARCDVRPVIRRLRDTLLRLHAEKEVALDLDVDGAPSFAGERQDLEEMLGNLLENACKWARSRVVVRARDGGGALRLEVEDDGPGIDAAQADVALRRGARLDDAKPGSGLGLAIAADLAALYGGTLALDASALGGLRARLELPAA
ncbi:MAG: ATP-binding protein [Thermodesulfobacteriota bacterium]